jgi:hypothetical protein
LAGRPEDFFALKKGVMLANLCAAAAALVFQFFLMRGHCLAPFCPPIANLKNASFEGREKKRKMRKNQEK